MWKGISSKPAVCTLFGLRDWLWGQGFPREGDGSGRVASNEGAACCSSAAASAFTAAWPGFSKHSQTAGVRGPMLYKSRVLVSRAVVASAVIPQQLPPELKAGWGLGGGLLTHGVHRV